MRMILRLGIAFALCAWAGSAVEWKTLRQQGHVSDFAGVVDVLSKRQLEDYCGAVQRAAGVRIDLVTLPTLQGEPVEDVARALASAWGSEGLLLLLATGDHKGHLEVRPAAAPLMARSIEAQTLWQMGPALRDQHYGEALLDGAETLGGAVSRGRGIRAPASTRRQATRPWNARIPWPAVLGGAGLIVVLMAWFRLARRRADRAFGGRSTWGSRGSGGFGGFDSTDSFGGFGGDTSSPRASGDW